MTHTELSTSELTLATAYKFWVKGTTSRISLTESILSVMALVCSSLAPCKMLVIRSMWPLAHDE